MTPPLHREPATIPPPRSNLFPPPDSGNPAPGISNRVWVGLMLMVAAWVGWRLNLLDLTARVATIDGLRRLPETFASVDHPFHAARAETLRQSLGDGQLLRWIGNHQGGYPVEFYPLGVAWLEVGLWALTVGMFSMAAVHKLLVGLVLLAPGVGFALIARRDRQPLAIALLALVIHLTVAGGPWHGGYTELVQWGLVTNVTASVALLFVLLGLTAYLQSGSGIAAAGATAAAGFAIVANPRSLVPLAAIGAGVWIAVAAGSKPRHWHRWRLAGRLGLVGALAALLAAPVLVSLLRFNDFYSFLHFDGYASARGYLTASVEAVTLPVYLLALVGVVLAWRIPALVVARAAATTFLLYTLLTLLLASQQGALPLLSQLEATRLMPFQRLLTIYLGAVALVWIVHAVARRPRSLPAFSADVAIVAIVGVLVALVSFSGEDEIPLPAVDTPTLALYPVETTATPEQADLEAAVTAADAAAAPGTALLILDSALSWHQQLWAPFWTDRPLFYDDWLWYWHPDHAGAAGYAFAAGHFYPNPAAALAPDFLSRHGIGAVVAGPAMAPAAASVPGLAEVRQGIFTVYVVEIPTTILTFNGANAATIAMENGRITATGESPGGEAVIRHNWFPRWRATVNGRPAPVQRTPGGYMTVPVPPGAVTIELRYVVDTIDWLARLSSIGGGGATVAAAWIGIVRQRPGDRRPPWR